MLSDELAAAKAFIAALESDIAVWRTIAFEAIAGASALRRENEMGSTKAYIYRTRSESRRQGAV